MQDKPKLSVIAGIYFPPDICFRRFLDACLNQTITNVEFIFLLDSPQDIQSRNILKEYEHKFKANHNIFIVVSNNTNLGVVNTYLKGCKLSHSDNILIVDSDDFFDDDLIEKMYNHFIAQKLDFLAPRILMSYLGELDVFYALNNNDDPTDTGIMFRKHILDEYEEFKKYINYTLISTIQKTHYKVDILPLDLGCFYYYTITNRSATSSFILQDKGEVPKSKEYELYKSGVIRFIETFLSNTMNKTIKFEDYTLDELKEMAKIFLDVDNFLDNNLTYEELKTI